jgi:hypothetical protein
LCARLTSVSSYPNTSSSAVSSTNGLYFAAVSTSDIVLDTKYPKFLLCVDNVWKYIREKRHATKKRWNLIYFKLSFVKLQLILINCLGSTYEQWNIWRDYSKILIDAQLRNKLQDLFVLIRDCVIIVKLNIHFFHVFPEIQKNKASEKTNQIWIILHEKSTKPTH